MLSKTIISKGKPTIENSDDSVLKIGVSRIKMADYEIHHYFKEKIKEVALPFGEIQTTTCMDLDQVRKLIDKIQENNVQDRSTASGGWCFVDAVTAGRFFRIGNAVWEFANFFREITFYFDFSDRAQETLHYVLDICDGSTLFILDEENDEEEEVSTVQALISEVELQDEADEASKGAASREKKSSNSSTARY